MTKIGVGDIHIIGYASGLILIVGYYVVKNIRKKSNLLSLPI